MSVDSSKLNNDIHKSSNESQCPKKRHKHNKKNAFQKTKEKKKKKKGRKESLNKNIDQWWDKAEHVSISLRFIPTEMEQEMCLLSPFLPVVQIWW